MTQYQSQFGLRQKVNVDFQERPMIGKVLAVHFYKDSHNDSVHRVKYDVEIGIAFEESTRIYNIDEKFISENQD